MKKHFPRSVTLFAAALALAMLAACEREGPMERAGKQVDESAEKAGKKIEQAGEAIKDKTR